MSIPTLSPLCSLTVPVSQLVLIETLGGNLFFNLLASYISNRYSSARLFSLKNVLGYLIPSILQIAVLVIATVIGQFHRVIPNVLRQYLRLFVCCCNPDEYELFKATMNIWRGEGIEVTSIDDEALHGITNTACRMRDLWQCSKQLVRSFDSEGNDIPWRTRAFSCLLDFIEQPALALLATAPGSFAVNMLSNDISNSFQDKSYLVWVLAFMVPVLVQVWMSITFCAFGERKTNRTMFEHLRASVKTYTHEEFERFKSAMDCCRDGDTALVTILIGMERDEVPDPRGSESDQEASTTMDREPYEGTGLRHGTTLDTNLIGMERDGVPGPLGPESDEEASTTMDREPYEGTGLRHRTNRRTEHDEEPTHQLMRLPRHTVGLERRAHEVQEKLKGGAVLGISGIGGIGKTTVAKAVFNIIANDFEYTCFVNDVQHIPMIELPEAVLKPFHHNGIKWDAATTEWSQMCGKKVLIVMDDIDSVDQLRFLPPWQAFGLGSCLVMTGRNEADFRFYKNCISYKVGPLRINEATKLFCKYAFGSVEIPQDRSKQLTKHVEVVVEKCCGLPLMLGVMGQYLSGDVSDAVWHETADNLRKAVPIDGGQNENDKVSATRS